MTVVCCVGSGLCDKLINRPEESYRFFVFIIVCDLETSTNKRQSSALGSCVADKQSKEDEVTLQRL